MKTKEQKAEDKMELEALIKIFGIETHDEFFDRHVVFENKKKDNNEKTYDND